MGYGLMAMCSSLRIYEVLQIGRDRGASDVHIFGDGPVVLRVDGRLDRLDAWEIGPQEIESFLAESFDETVRRRLREHGNGDGSLQHPRIGPLRIHAFLGRGGARLAIRLLAITVPVLELMGLPSMIAKLAHRRSGIVLFTGPTGSGKSTAMAALIDRINRTQERHIVTVEDPVEYYHKPQCSIIAHCEVGTDVSSFGEALRGFMRADPDVIMVGEMRDLETMSAAITAAETGHLVLATLHSPETAISVDRLVDSFPAGQQQQIRSQLAQTLIAVIGMRLLPLKRGPGRRAAAEILLATDAVRAMIREGKTYQLRNAIATGRAAGMQTLETHLSDLVVHGEVTLEAARSVAEHPGDVRELARSAG
jgi:twitching motility protein PilT